MNESSSSPLLSADVDLRDFAFMPLDVVRLRDSRLSSSATGDEFRAAVLLWCASWHQIPAGSLPNDDAQLAALCGYGRVVKEWKKVRAGALHGWVLCSDQRWYHPVVVEKAIDAWDKKLQQRWRTECARIRQHNKRHEMNLPCPDFDDWKAAGCHTGQPLSVTRDMIPPDARDRPGVSHEQTANIDSKGQGQGEGQGEEESKPPGVSLRSTPATAVAAATEDGKARGDPGHRAKLWADGRALLHGSGVGDEAARAFLGALVRDFGQVLVGEALAEAQAVVPPDPRAWLTARCQERRANGREAGDAWWTSDAKIEAKGQAVGLTPRPGEGWPQYRDRIALKLAEAKGRAAA